MSGGYHTWSKFNAHRWSNLNARRHPKELFVSFCDIFSALTWQKIHFLWHPTTVLDVDTRIQRIGFNEFPTRFDIFAHQRGEDFVGSDGVIDLYAQQTANLRVHGRFP